MRIAIPCIILVFSCGCTVVPNDAWTFDPTRAQSKPVLPVEQAVRMTVVPTQKGREATSVEIV